MSGITQKQQEQRHRKVDEAIEKSILPTADTVQAIAEKTGEHPSFVHRRFLKLGLKWDGRWVWKHNERQ